MLAKKINKNRVTANQRDLETLVGSMRIELRGTGHMKSRSRRSYYWFAELAARGFDTVRAPIGAHAHYQWLAFGHTKSISTIQRSFKELEDQGYIRRLKCRRGDISTIKINVEKFSFYLQRNKRFKAVPVGTFEHTQLHRSICDSDEFTDSYRLKSTDRSYDVTTSLYNNKAKKGEKSFLKWIHPLVFTIGVLCWPMGKRERQAMQKYAVRAIKEQVPPFDYWTAERWQAMSIPAREKECSENILPWLKEYRERIEKKLEAGEICGPEKEQENEQEYQPPPGEPPSQELTEHWNRKLSAFFAQYTKDKSIPPPLQPVDKEKREKLEKARAAAPTLLTADEMEILQWADKNKGRRNGA